MRVFRIADDVPGSRLTLRAGRRRWQFERERVTVAGGGWLDGRSSVPTSSVDAVRLTLHAPSGGDLALALALRHRHYDDAPFEIAEDLRVADLDRAPEALDLAFRIAQAIDFHGYQVRRDGDRTTIELLRHGPVQSSPYRAAWAGVRDVAALSTSSEPQPVAVLTAPADYTSGPRFLEPPFPVAPVAAGDDIAQLRVVAWSDDVIELDASRTATPWQLFTGLLGSAFVVLLTLLILVGVPCVTWWLTRWTYDGLFGPDPEAAFYGWKDYAAFAVWATFLLALWIVAILCPFAIIDLLRQFTVRLHTVARHRGQPRHARFDLRTGQLTLRVGSRTRTAATADIESIVHHTRELGVDSWSELELQLPGDDELLLVTPTGLGDRPAVFRLTIALARALDLPWRVAGPDPTTDDPLKPLRPPANPAATPTV